MEKPPPPRGRRASAVSLSPLKARKELEESVVAPVRRRAPKPKIRPSFGVALSKAETVLVTGAGDVLTSRCRYSSKAYIARNQAVQQWTAPTPQFWWEDPDCHVVCSPCDGNSQPRIAFGEGLLGGGLLGGGLLGGAAMVSTYSNDLDGSPADDLDALAPSELPSNAVDTREKGEAPPDLVSTSNDLDTSLADDLDALAVLPSFDYSYFTGDGNDMVPNSLTETLSPLYEEQQAMENVKEPHNIEPRVAPPVLMHGVPTFLPAFFQIRITQVSANPLGSHALLISTEALLFSYGLNTHGQLGHGHKSSVTNGSNGFVTTPTIVTPLLENGGKAVVCAAGVDYSLVVVQTEEKRVGRLQNRRSFTRYKRHSSDDVQMARTFSLPSRIVSEDDESSDDAVKSMCHHQLYGFGNNDGMKLGLVNPGTGNTSQVLLPRRVALHCKVWPGMDESDENLPPSGVFAIAASARHSAALVRRATGAIELYTWGDATFGALDSLKGDTPKGRNGHQVNGLFTHLPLAVTVPTLVKGLSYSSTDQSPKARDRIPVQVALGPRSTFVITLSGQCLSFGKSECGLLGQGDGITSTVEPGLIVFPSAGKGVKPKIKSISVGSQHAIAVASDGRAFAWGNNEGHVMGFDSALRKHLSLRAKSAGDGRERSPFYDEIEWIPREIEIPSVLQPAISKTKLIRVMSESRTVHMEGAPPRADEKEKGRVVQAWAGIDLTVFVTETGSVLSCGASSGRLGLGETSSTPFVVSPTPMFGGLHLWR